MKNVPNKMDVGLFKDDDIDEWKYHISKCLYKF